MKERSFTCQRDGLTIRGTEFRPDGDRLPAVILSHGFMGNESHTQPYARILVEKGFAAFTYDFCGGGPVCSSDGRTQDMTVFTEREDLKAVFAYVSALPYVDASRILLWGFSQGGFVSALAAAELGDAVEKLIMYYPAFCIPDDARRGEMVMARFDPADIPETVACGPMLLGRCYPESVLDFDPYTVIGTYTGPVLIVHGTADSLVKYEYSVKAVPVYRNAKLVPIEGANHGFQGADDEKSIEIVKEWLGV